MLRTRARLILLGLLPFLALGMVYASLAAYKARQYVTTPDQPPIVVSPGDLGLPWEDVTFPATEDGLHLAGWWIPRDRSNRVIILVHGRYENRTAHLALTRPLWEAGYNVLLFDLRGHGESANATCSYGLREQRDVVGAAAWLRGRGFEPGSIGVIGWSLGAVSALLATEHSTDIAAVVSDSAYADSEPLLARNPLHPGLRLALRTIYDINLDRIQLAETLARPGPPVLLIHGATDGAVPASHAERLRTAGKSRVTDTWIVLGAGHIGAQELEPDEYTRRVLEFFDTTLN